MGQLGMAQSGTELAGRGPVTVRTRMALWSPCRLPADNGLLGYIPFSKPRSPGRRADVADEDLTTLFGIWLSKSLRLHGSSSSPSSLVRCFCSSLIRPEGIMAFIAFLQLLHHGLLHFAGVSQPIASVSLSSRSARLHLCARSQRLLRSGNDVANIRYLFGKISFTSASHAHSRRFLTFVTVSAGKIFHSHRKRCPAYDPLHNPRRCDP